MDGKLFQIELIFFVIFCFQISRLLPILFGPYPRFKCFISTTSCDSVWSEQVLSFVCDESVLECYSI